MRVIATLFLVLLFGGCSPQYSDFFPYHDDGTPKPYVALLPVIDESEQKLPWNFPQEMSTRIRADLMKQGQLFLPSLADMQKKLAATSEAELATGSDLMPFLYFQPAHFVIVLELIEHSQVPYQRGKTKPLYIANISPEDAEILMMKVRMRIVDIRGGEPRLIRQEVIQSNHMIPKGALEQACQLKGSDGFGATPVGIAHARLIADIVHKIERITTYQKP